MRYQSFKTGEPFYFAEKQGLGTSYLRLNAVSSTSITFARQFDIGICCAHLRMIQLNQSPASACPIG